MSRRIREDRARKLGVAVQPLTTGFEISRFTPQYFNGFAIHHLATSDNQTLSTEAGVELHFQLIGRGLAFQLSA